jgi:hypothetical protein
LTFNQGVMGSIPIGLTNHFNMLGENKGQQTATK